MKRVFLLFVVTLVVVFVIAGCSPVTSVSPTDEEEIWLVIRRYFKAISLLRYEEARACLYPGGPTDQGFDALYGQIEPVLSSFLGTGCTVWVDTDVANISVRGNEATAELRNADISVLRDSQLLWKWSFEESSGGSLLLKKYEGQWRIY